MFYIYIDDLIELLWIVILVGISEFWWLFGSGVGLFLDWLFFGFEGMFGIIIEVWMWL